MEEKINSMLQYLDEKQRRIYLATEAISLGHGGITKVANASGVSRVTITNGIKELTGNESLSVIKSRKKGGGRKKTIDKNPELLSVLKSLIDSTTRGEPDSSLLWTTKSLRNLSSELKTKGYNVGRDVVSRILNRTFIF